MRRSSVAFAAAAGLVAFQAAAPGPCAAEPALGKPRAAGPLPVVYPDARDARVFYYPPGPLGVASDAAGGPDLRFLQMIYMGSHATADPGRFIARSVLSFRVQMTPPPAADLQAARAALPAGARMLPVPIRRAETQLVWTPIVDDASGTAAPVAPDTPTPSPAPSPETHLVGGGQLEEADGAAAAADGYWTERIFTLNPDPFSSQALWDALQKRRVLLSLSYTFYSEGDTQGPTAVTGTPEAVGAVREAAGTRSEAGATGQGPKKELAVVRSDVLAIRLDPGAVAERLRRIDVNQTVPPGYAALDVRCYDFGNALRPDLALKTVEVAATGVSGQTVTRSASFRSSSPEVTSATVRFPFAVRLDRPFRLRVTEVSKDGDRRVGEWQDQGDWARLVDVTTRLPATPEPTPEPTPAPTPEPTPAPTPAPGDER